LIQQRNGGTKITTRLVTKGRKRAKKIAPRKPKKVQTTRKKRVVKPAWMKLTKAEERLLFNPPTPATWICPAKNHPDVVGECLNSGLTVKCPMCGNKKPLKPKLLWPAYVKICEKTEIDPGTPGFEARRILKKKEEQWYLERETA